MRRAALLALVLLTAFPLSARRRSVAVSEPYVVTAADAIAAAALAEGVPSVTIAVQRGTSLFTRSYGVFDLETGAAATPDTVYQIASVSKQFTAAAIMRLFEEEKLALDDRAGLYLPELDSRFDAITIRHLLNHTSGLRDYLFDLEEAFEPMTQQEIVDLMTAHPLEFEPGARYKYSNSGYFLLGMIVERLSAMNYGEYLRKTFFEPLGLGRTSYCGSREPAPGGTLFFEGEVIPVPPVHMSLVEGAGALCSTAADLIRWNTALTAGLAVAPSSFDRMIGQGVRILPGLHYGFGLVVDTRTPQVNVWHNGSILGFQSMLLWSPEKQLTIAVLVNMTDLARDRAGEIARALAQTIP